MQPAAQGELSPVLRSGSSVVVGVGDDFVPRHLGMSGGRCYWNQVGRGQRCCQHLAMHRTVPTTIIPTQKVETSA